MKVNGSIRKNLILFMIFILAVPTVFFGGAAQKASAAISSATPVPLVNAGFESGDLTGWTVTDSTYGGVKRSIADVHTGEHGYSYWYDQGDYKFRLSQTVTGLVDGKYELRAWSLGENTAVNVKLFAESGSRNYSMDIVNTGWGTNTPDWKRYTVADIEVVNGEASIGFDVDATSNYWGWFDDVEFVKIDDNVQPYDPSQFIKGADISTLQALEDKGAKFYDGGVETDLLTILKDRGVNYIRLRLWNDPKQSGQAPDGTYYNDRAHTIKMAKRVKQAGFKLLLDFHYSDIWAHPGQQVKPADWEGLTFEQLKDAVYGYTSDVMNELRNEGAYPDMVQIGNEINTGIIHPEGSNENFDQMVQLLKEGIQAVRDTTPAGQDTKIMLHLAEGGKNGVFVDFFNKIEAAGGVDYDIIGISYYPYWHGTFYDLKYNMDDLVKRYNKPVIVAETAYAFTADNGDDLPNNVGPKEIETVGLPATVDNQKLVLETVFNTVASVNGHQGLGAFYWEPAWLKEVGWTTGEGNAWENQAMFDFNGNALDSLDAFKFTPGSLAVQPILVYPSLGVTVYKGENPVLPSTVEVQYNDGSMKSENVVWDAISADQLNRTGKFTVYGTVSGFSQKAKIEITVKDQINYVKNYSFESGDLSDWTLTGTSKDVGQVKDETGNAHSGKHAFNYWNGQDFAYELTQTVKDLPNGSYTLKAYVSGEKEDPANNKVHSAFQLFAENSAGDKKFADVETTGWNQWKQYVVENIQVTEGQLKIGFNVEATAGMWGWIDDIELIQNAPTPAPVDPTPTTPTPSTPSTTSTPSTPGTGSKDSGNSSSKSVTVSSDRLKQNAAGAVSVTVPADTTAVNLPGAVVSSIGEKSLEISDGTLSLAIPAELLKKLGEQAEGAKDWNLSLKIDRQAGTTVQQALHQAGTQDAFTDIKIAGSVYDLKLSVIAGGTEKEVDALAAPLTVTLKPDVELNQNTAGIYFISPEGQLEYAGGKWVNGQIVVQISELRPYALLEVNKRFGDVVDAHWANQAVSSLAAKQIITGTESGVFEPGRAVTRAEFIAMLARTLKLESKAASTFTDVPEAAWYANAVNAAFAAGIVKGKDGLVFDPNAAITREEMAVMLMNAYAYAGGTSGEAVASETFKDAGEISEWAESAVTSAESAGLIQGNGEGNFAPGASLTRAEAAQAVYRLVNK